MRPPLALLAALLLATATAASAAPKVKEGESSKTRRDLQALQRAVEGAVGQVARPAGGLGNGHLSRAYRLPGNGIVVVLAPRFLPAARRASADPQVTRALDEALRGLEESLRRAESPEVREEIRRSMQQLRETRIRLVSRPGAAMRLVVPPEMEAELVAMNAHAEAFRREAEQAQRDAERQLQANLRAMEGAPEPTLAAEPARTAAPPAAPQPPTAPEPPEAPQAPMALVSLADAVSPGGSGDLLAPMPPAPWEFWFSINEEPESRSADELVASVRDAVASALATHRGPWSSLSGEETVSVAVDFVPRGSSDAPRTLVVRARVADLTARAAGKIDDAELQRRIHTAEY